MRTTLDLPEPLIEEARRLPGFKSETDTVDDFAEIEKLGFVRVHEV
jgi:hypothetical protein